MFEAHPKFHWGKMNHSARKHSGGIDFDPLKEQQFFPSIDVDLGPQWEFNLELGWAQPDRPIA